ncbi:antA/AntB antirepressor family protein [Brevibacterium paucivorans]|uniref:antA/AntB antirepressor family protein n=1 Tax=Brevibacterium paucivorans TaxID=170994 RepID=UPI00321BACBF
MAIIPIDTRADGTVAVSGRDLHKFLEVKTAYKDWFPRMTEYGFTEGQDFSSFLSESTGGRPSTDHALTLDMAKEVSMIQRTDRGKQARQYFIEAEKKLRTQAQPNPYADQIPKTYADALRAHAQAIEARDAMESYARELEPKADAYARFIDADGTYAVGTVAKMLGLSQNKLFDRLRGGGIFISKGPMRNTPYQQYMHHFAVKAYEYERTNGTRGTSYTTRVLGTGVEFIARKLGLEVRAIS